MTSPVVIRCLTTDVPRRSRSWLHRHRRVQRAAIWTLLFLLGMALPTVIQFLGGAR